MKQVEFNEDLHIFGFGVFPNKTFVCAVNRKEKYLQVVELHDNKITYLPQSFSYFLSKQRLIGDVTNGDYLITGKRKSHSELRLYDPEDLDTVIATVDQSTFKIHGIDIFGFIIMPELAEKSRQVHFKQMPNQKEIDLVQKYGWNLPKIENKQEFIQDLSLINSRSSNQLLNFLMMSKHGFDFLYKYPKLEPDGKFEHLLNQFLCPISMSVINDPVVASDGFTYEYEALIQSLKVNLKSPKTGEQLQLKVFPNHFFKQQLRKVLDEIFLTVDEQNYQEIPQFYIIEKFDQHKLKLIDYKGDDVIKFMQQLERK